MHDSGLLRDDFREIIVKHCGVDFFNDRENGSLFTTVHTGRSICDFDVQIDFSDDAIRFTTMSGIGVEDNRKEVLDSLIRSINECERRARFIICKDNRLSSVFTCTFDEFLKLENPFDAIDYGIDIFRRYSEMFLKAMLGQAIISVKI